MVKILHARGRGQNKKFNKKINKYLFLKVGVQIGKRRQSKCNTLRKETKLGFFCDRGYLESGTMSLGLS